MGAFSTFRHVHSKAINVVTSIALSMIILLCYVLVLILFLKPSYFHLESLITPAAKGIKPTTTVTLITTLFIGATSALITRSVEHSLWLKLTPRDVQKQLTVGESRRLAEWSVSPLGRLLYVYRGAHILLKAAGVLIFATAAVSPVLVSGISQTPLSNTVVSSTPHQGDIWNGWLDVANSAFNGGNFADVPGIIGALATLSNLSAPASPVCTRSGCSATAVASSIRASCKSSSQPHPSSLRGNGGLQVVNETYTSSYNPSISVTLSSGSPYVYANFSGGYTSSCESVSSACSPGEWSVIFGAFVNATDTLNGPWFLNTVDCLLTFGTVKISQDAGNTPVIQDGTFQQNSTTSIPTSIVPLHRIYTEENGYACPYYFTAASGTGDQADSLYKSPIATLLLHPKANSSGADVAQRIEDIFEMTTLLAFSRSSSSSDLTTTNVTLVPVYVYKWQVLLILIIPLMATILGTWGRWRVGDKDQIVGYDPVEIAKRGPVSGLPDQTERKETANEDEVDTLRVWSIQETTLAADGSSIMKEKFVVGS